MTSIVQDWAAELGLRHQGVLMAAVRGCDTVVRDDPIKLLARFYRACVLKAHVGDPRASKSFIMWMDKAQFWSVATVIVRSHDHYPHHYLMHLIHAAEILGYHYAGDDVAPVRGMWRDFYYSMCDKMHMSPETPDELSARLNADEQSFSAAQ